MTEYRNYTPRVPIRLRADAGYRLKQDGWTVWQEADTPPPVSEPPAAPEPAPPVPVEPPRVYRGLHIWRGQQRVPIPLSEHAPARYQRGDMRVVWPARDRLNTAWFDAEIAKCAASGFDLALRLRALVPETNAVPDHLMHLTVRCAYGDPAEPSQTGVVVPRFDHPDWRAAYREFIQRVAAYLRDKIRLAWVDIDGGGLWGESHVYGLQLPGDVAYTEGYRRWLVDTYYAAFDPAILVTPTDASDLATYALGRDPRIGWRRDSLGQPHFETGITKQGAGYAELLKTRARTALAIGEAAKNADAVLARQQATAWGLWTVGNGNMASYDTQRAEWLTLSQELRAER